MRRFLLLGWLCCVAPAFAQSEVEALPVYYAVNERATVFRGPDSTEAYFNLNLREPVYLLAEEGRWCKVRTQHGHEGYVAEEALSNVWVRVSKRSRRVYLYEGTKLVRELPADFGRNAFADKQRRGGVRNPDDWRTPEGVFYVVARNARSTFYKAFVLNYPTADDAKRGLKQGLISKKEHDAIVRADERMTRPPMSTALGGWIEIHGNGTGGGVNWTQGCVAVTDAHMDDLWAHVQVGTPVLIEP